jgi:hypothetical protein
MTDLHPPAPEEPAEPLLVFIHIPKSAGTTLGTLLRRHYGEQFIRINTSGAWDAEELRGRVRSALAKPGVRVVQGHVPFGLRESFPADAQYATLLRDPVERTLSQYHHLVTRVGRWRHEHLPPPSPDLALADCFGARNYIADDLQTRMVCGIGSRIDPLPPDALEQAKRNLRERFTYVGTTERFDDFLALLNAGLGWPTVGYESARVRSEGLRKDDLPPEDLRLVEEANALDLELHEYGGELLEEALGRAGSAVEVD